MLAAMVWLCCAIPQQAVDPAALLSQIRRRMAENLAHLPDYTCRETIERSVRNAGSRRFTPVDTLRFEVSYVGGKELFAWPGADKFEERDLFEMVNGGAASSGNFATHAHAVFATDAPSFTWVGQTVEGGRRVVRFDFRVARERSRYIVKTGVAAVVAYYGSFWADADTLDLIRLRVETGAIPGEIDIERGGETMEYGRARIGAADFLLPRSSEVLLLDRVGRESRNRVSFDACRQYAGESVIRFGEVQEQAAPAAVSKAAPPAELPAGLTVETVLDSRIDAAKSAIGDPVRAVVTHQVTKDGAVLVEKGAVLGGRISRLRHFEARGGRMYLVGIVLDTVTQGGARAPFRGRLDTVDFTNSRRYSVVPAREEMLPGEGMFTMRGGQSAAFSRLRMVWRTAAR
jgi:hypothetical protein